MNIYDFRNSKIELFTSLTRGDSDGESFFNNGIKMFLWQKIR